MVVFNDIYLLLVAVLIFHSLAECEGHKAILVSMKTLTRQDHLNFHLYVQEQNLAQLEKLQSY